MIIPIKATFSKNVNVLFRLKNRIRPFISRRNNLKDIPVIINNYNRLSYLKQLINWLEEAGLTNIHIIDNASSYPPLLSFYKMSGYTIYRLDKNIGHESLWKTHIFTRFCHDYYIYTDPDVVPVEECPTNFLAYFMEQLSLFPGMTKIGFGLKIDDLPDHNPRKEEVISWEKQFWKEEIAPNIFKAPIDTTFALYKPNMKFQQWETTLRSGGKYMARHLPWYENPDTPEEEEIYFRQHTTNVSSWYKNPTETYNG